MSHKVTSLFFLQLFDVESRTVDRLLTERHDPRPLLRPAGRRLRVRPPSTRQEETLRCVRDVAPHPCGDDAPHQRTPHGTDQNGAGDADPLQTLIGRDRVTNVHQPSVVPALPPFDRDIDKTELPVKLTQESFSERDPISAAFDALYSGVVSAEDRTPLRLIKPDRMLGGGARRKRALSESTSTQGRVSSGCVAPETGSSRNVTLKRRQDGRPHSNEQGAADSPRRSKRRKTSTGGGEAGCCVACSATGRVKTTAASHSSVSAHRRQRSNGDCHTSVTTVDSDVLQSSVSADRRQRNNGDCDASVTTVDSDVLQSSMSVDRLERNNGDCHASATTVDSDVLQSSVSADRLERNNGDCHASVTTLESDVLLQSSVSADNCIAAASATTVESTKTRCTAKLGLTATVLTSGRAFTDKEGRSPGQPLTVTARETHVTKQTFSERQTKAKTRQTLAVTTRKTHSVGQPLTAKKTLTTKQPLAVKKTHSNRPTLGVRKTPATRPTFPERQVGRRRKRVVLTRAVGMVCVSCRHGLLASQCQICVSASQEADAGSSSRKGDKAGRGGKGTVVLKTSGPAGVKVLGNSGVKANGVKRSSKASAETSSVKGFGKAGVNMSSTACVTKTTGVKESGSAAVKASSKPGVKTGVKARMNMSSKAAVKAVGAKTCGKAGLKMCNKAGMKMSSKAGVKMCNKAGMKMSSKAGVKMSCKAGVKMSSKAGVKMSCKAGVKMSSKASVKMSSKAGVKMSSKASVKMSSKTGVKMPYKAGVRISSSSKAGVKISSKAAVKTSGKVGEKKRTTSTKSSNSKVMPISNLNLKGKTQTGLKKTKPPYRQPQSPSKNTPEKNSVASLILQRHEQMSAECRGDSGDSTFFSTRDVFSQLCRLERRFNESDAGCLATVMPLPGPGAETVMRKPLYAPAATSRPNHVGGVWKSIFHER